MEDGGDVVSVAEPPCCDQPRQQGIEDGLGVRLELVQRRDRGVGREHRGAVDLARAHEVFFTSALMDALPARSVHDVAEYGPAHVARRVREALRAERGDSPDAARDGATPR